MRRGISVGFKTAVEENMSTSTADARTIKGGYRTIEHTADIGIEVSGATAEELYALSACAMFDLLVDLSEVRPTQKAEVSLRAESPEELMVAWLNELIFRAEVRGMFFSRFEVVRVSERTIEASIWGEPYCAGRHSVERQIKAATYHELEISHSDKAWSARIIFDV